MEQRGLGFGPFLDFGLPAMISPSLQISRRQNGGGRTPEGAAELRMNP